LPIVPSRLASKHLDEMLAYEKEYPPEYRLGRDVLSKKLKDLEESGCSMAWIMHDNALCVAYIVVYPQFSRLQRRQKERVIYVDDVFVKKGYEVCLFRLIQLFTQEATRIGMRDCAIEGVCRVDAYRAFATHDPLLKKLGWELAKKSEYWDPTVNEEMCWLRWEPLYQQDARFKTGDSVSVSREEDGLYKAEKLVTFADSHRYSYRPPVMLEDYEEDNSPDDLSALTEVMLGKDEDPVEIMATPPVRKKTLTRKKLQDVFGIHEFFGLPKPDDETS
jgi:hypothetical protein